MLLAAAPAAGQAPAVIVAPASTPAVRDESRTNVTVSADGRALIIDGPLVSGTAARFASVAGRHPGARTVYLHSPGGIVGEAERIADFVRDHDLDTYVETGCLSACTMILLSGRDRAVAPAARVGFHAPIWTGPARSLGQAFIERYTRRFFVERGIAPAFANRVLATPHSAMWYPTYSEMVAAGVVNRQTLGGETQALFSAMRSPEEFRAAFRTHAYWRAIEARHPDVAERAAQVGWAARSSGKNDGEIAAAMRGVVIEAMPRMFRHAPDEVLEGFLRLVIDQIHLVRAISYTACNQLARGRGGGPGLLPQAMVDRELALYQQAIEAPPVEVEFDAAAAEEIFTRMLSQLPEEQAEALAAAQEPDQAADLPSLCEGALAMYQGVAALPPADRRLALRLMFTTE
ncbi:MAG TPA: hypothetical protein VGB08_08735 [Allosphingosinicella sp.]